MAGERAPILDDFQRDVRLAARTLLRAPGVAVAVASLALAVGAVSAVHGTSDWLLGRSPGGVLEADRVYSVRLVETARPDLGTFGFSFPQYEELERIQDTFEEIAAFGKLPRIVSNGSRTDQRVLELATSEYFSLLGLRPELGRLFGPEDDRVGAEPVAVLSHAFWQSWFGGDPSVLGRIVEVQGTRVRVIGVMDHAFEGYSLDWNGPTDLWMPARSTPALGIAVALTSPSSFWPVVGRLRPDVSATLAIERAQAWVPELPPLEAQMFEADAIELRASADMRISRRAEARRFLGALTAVSVLILLAACFNVSNFFLGRATLRRREIALRAAVGASRLRIARQLLAEALVVTGAVSVAGALFGFWIGSALAPLPSIYLGRGDGLTTHGALDVRFLAATVALAAVTSMVFGLLPMLSAFRRPLDGIRRSRPLWGWGRLRLTSRHRVLALQVALAVVLAVSAGLFVRTFREVASVDSELADPRTLLLARIVPFGLTAEEGTAFYEALLARLETMPRVRSASIGWNPPFRQGHGQVGAFGSEGRAVEAGLTTAGPRFFETLGQSVVAGRELRSISEDAGSIVLNRVLAERLFPGEEAVGRSVTYPGSEPKVVVGVVARRRCESLFEQEGACAWHPFPMGRSSGYLRVRTRGAALEFVPVLSALVEELGPGVAVTEQQAADEFLRDMTGAHRVAAVASAGLALFGLLLLVLGCVSLFVSLVRDSVGEIAVRMALGATGGRITREVSRHGLGLVLVGVALGLLSARALTPRFAGLFYETSPTDPLIFVAVGIVVPAVAMASVGWAAATATRTRPAEHLRAG